MITAKRGADGQPLSKNSRNEADGRMKMENVINPAPEAVMKGKVKENKTKNKVQIKKAINPRNEQYSVERSEKYYVVRALTNAKNGISFAQFGEGDPAVGRKELDGIFGKGGLNMGVVSEETNEQDDVVEDKCLTVTLVKLQCTEV